MAAASATFEIKAIKIMQVEYEAGHMLIFLGVEGRGTARLLKSPSSD